jgi:hypothetical protein
MKSTRQLGACGVPCRGVTREGKMDNDRGCKHWSTYYAWVEHLGRLVGVIKCNGCTLTVREP